jgi:hypothetical protein
MAIRADEAHTATALLSGSFRGLRQLAAIHRNADRPLVTVASHPAKEHPMIAESVALSSAPSWLRRPDIARGAVASVESRMLVCLVRPDDHRRDRFICGIEEWARLVEVAVVFGWKQLGTTYLRSSVPPAKTESSQIMRHDYIPGDIRDPKVVDGSDAMAWAVALGTARRSPHLSNMLRATDEVTSARMRAHALAARTPFTNVVDEFTRYAFGGTFSFVRNET